STASETIVGTGMSASDGSVLGEPVRGFAAAVGLELHELSVETGRAASLPACEHDAVADAIAIVGSIVTADGRPSFGGGRAVVASFSPWLTSLAHLTPETVRSSSALTRHQAFAEHPSPMLIALVEADRKFGTARAKTYYRAAMGVAHAACAIDPT